MKFSLQQLSPPTTLPTVEVKTNWLVSEKEMEDIRPQRPTIPHCPSVAAAAVGNCYTNPTLHLQAATTTTPPDCNCCNRPPTAAVHLREGKVKWCASLVASVCATCAETLVDAIFASFFLSFNSLATATQHGEG